MGKNVKTIDVYLTRHRRSDQGTEGKLSVPELGFASVTLELPWRDNKPCISCIPPGTYPLVWRVSKKWKAYHIKDVPDRSWILTHPGNFAGDAAKGYKTNVQGCILQGRYIGLLQSQVAVLMSRPTVRRFNDLMAGRDARIIIEEHWEAKQHVA